MRVCFFTYFFPRITETFILNKITKLLDLGVDVQILAIANPRTNKAVEDRDLETITHNDIDNYNLMSRVTYIPKVSGEFNFDGIEQAIDMINPDIIHFQWSGLADHVFQQLSFDIPTITNFHEFNLPSNWRQVSSFQNIYNNSSLVLPVSNYLHQLIITDGCSPNKIITHHVGVDIQKFVPSINKTDGVLTFLTVAGLLEKKGYEDAIKVMSNLRHQGIEFRYKIIGDGVLMNILMELVSTHQLTEKVTFLGKLKQEDVITHYQSSDIFIHPSVTASDGSHEGIPTSIMEASACELPIVSTVHTGIPELVQNNKSGYLSPEHDIDSLTRTTLKLVENKKMRQQFGKEGRGIVSSQFNINILTSDVLDIYKKLIYK